MSAVLDISRAPPARVPDPMVLPLAMLEARRWLLWRAVQDRPGRKPRKVPHYADGNPRSGRLDTPEDAARLVTFREARDAYLRRALHWAGLSFALGPDGAGGCWQGIDLDGLGERPELRGLVDELPGYVERSPSGNGVHAIGYGARFDALSSNASGIEAYSAGRFFTVTGDALRADALDALPDLSGFVAEQVAPRHAAARREAPRGASQAGGASRDDSDADPFAGVPVDLTPDQVRDLRAALAVLDADDYAEWIAVGQALHAHGVQGFELWDEWARRSDKHDADDSARRWEGFAGERTGYAAIFKRAQARGWKNPRAAERQEIAGGEFSVSDAGVWFVGRDKDGDALPAVRVCSTLRVLAHTRTGDSGQWGRLLEWHDLDGRRHQWAMPAAALQGDGLEVRQALADGGVTIAPGKARALLAIYLQGWSTDARARCVDRPGWHGDAFVLPDRTVGRVGDTGGESVVFQSAQAARARFSTAGTLVEWRETVAVPAAGNARFVFALSCAFAGTLAELVDEDSGGFHLRGPSSSGKSTAQKVAASVWSEPKGYVQSWRTTDNALEGAAVLRNDGLLILDELKQCEPRAASRAAYMLANGQGKARADRSGAAREPMRWRVLYLSSGELSLSALLREAGERVDAGQEVRFADIAWTDPTDLHGSADVRQYVERLGAAAARSYGTAGAAWLDRVVAERATLALLLVEAVGRFIADALPPGASGQVGRVARRFALVAAAGELATRWGLTGWTEGEATRGARDCFACWLEGFAGSDPAARREDLTILAQVRAFFEAHGSARFEPVARWREDLRIVNRAGFFREWRVDAEGARLPEDPMGPPALDDGAVGTVREFYVLPEVFKSEVCHGLDVTAATRVLLAAGWIKPDPKGKAQRSVRLPGMGKTARAYVFTSRMWESDDEG